MNTSQKPLFGTSLQETAFQTGRKLSLVLECCVQELLQHLDEEGLFRIPGSTSKLKRLRTLFNLNAGAKQPPAELLLQLQHDPHSVAGCLKSYLRELPEPLLGYGLYQPLLAAARISDLSQRLTSLWQLIQQLPSVHLHNLKFLIKFLAKLATNSEQNKMNPQNIAIAIAPSLIWAPPEGDSILPPGLDMCAANHYGIIVDALVTYADWFFPGGRFSTILLSRPNQLFKFFEILVLETEVNGLSSEEKPDEQRAATPRTGSRCKKPAPPAPSPAQNPNRQLDDLETRTATPRKTSPTLETPTSSSLVYRMSTPNPIHHSRPNGVFGELRVNSAEPSDGESSGTGSKTSCSSSSSSTEQLDAQDSSLSTKSNGIKPRNGTRPKGLLAGGSLDRRQMRPNNFFDRRIASSLRHCTSSASSNPSSTLQLRHLQASPANSRNRPQSMHIERPTVPPPDRPVRVSSDPNKFAGVEDLKVKPSLSTFGGNVCSTYGSVNSSKFGDLKSSEILSEPARSMTSTFKPEPSKSEDNKSASTLVATFGHNRGSSFVEFRNGQCALVENRNLDNLDRKPPELPAKPPELLARSLDSALRQSNEPIIRSMDSVFKTIDGHRVPEKPPRNQNSSQMSTQNESAQLGCQSPISSDQNSSASFAEQELGLLISSLEMNESSNSLSNSSSSTSPNEHNTAVHLNDRVKPPRPSPPVFKPRTSTENTTHL